MCRSTPSPVLIAVLNLTIDNAPTMPKDSTTLEVTARITTVVIMVRAISVTPKPEEYITPEKVFLYTKKINIPSPKAKSNAAAISTTLTLETFSIKPDLKISLKVIFAFTPFLFIFPQSYDTPGNIPRRTDAGRLLMPAAPDANRHP